MVASATGALSTFQTGTETKSEIAKRGLAGDFDNFLVLLTTQLKNQDPSSPLDANQFTQQLVAFTGVEQAINTNTNLEKLISMQQSAQMNDAVGYLGKMVEAKGNIGSLDNHEAHFFYQLEKGASNVTYFIQNMAGQTVLTGSSDKTAGKHEIVWDGTDSAGNQLKDGKYKIIIRALDAEGNAMSVDTSIEDIVTGVTVEDGKPVLALGEGEGGNVTLDQVLSVKFRDFL